MPLMPKITMLLMPIAGLACGAIGDAGVPGLRSIPAHWVERTDTYEPDWGGDFTFYALSFSTATDGWIVGNRLMLQVTDGELAVAFVKPARAWLDTVDFRTPDDGWAGGSSLELRRSRSLPPWDSGPSAGVIWRFRNGRWESVDLSPLSWPDWSLGELRAAPHGEVWATAAINLGGDDGNPRAPRRFRPMLLEFDGAAWRVDESPREGERRWNFHDICFDEAGTGWFVGADFSANDAHRALAVRRVKDSWERSELPSLPGPNCRLTYVECLPGERAVAVGHCGSWPDQQSAPVLLRYDGVWHRVDLPEAFRDATVGAMAAVSDSDVWLALTSADGTLPGRPTFLHLVDGEWTECAPPLLPENRVDGYSFSGMQFVSPTEGWAIANDYGGPGIVRGLIFHYKDGVWRNRNWNWHFWDQHLFGLFGD